MNKQFGVTFPIMAKVDVNGDAAEPLFKFLKAKTSAGLFGWVGYDDILWNFNKFLVVDGIPVERYLPTTAPRKIDVDIEAALGKLTPGSSKGEL
jgi:glutathione peroxidase